MSPGKAADDGQRQPGTSRPAEPAPNAEPAPSRLLATRPLALDQGGAWQPGRDKKHR